MKTPETQKPFPTPRESEQDNSTPLSGAVVDSSATGAASGGGRKGLPERKRIAFIRQGENMALFVCVSQKGEIVAEFGAENLRSAAWLSSVIDRHLRNGGMF